MALRCGKALVDSLGDVAICPACEQDQFQQVGGVATTFPCDSRAEFPPHPAYEIRECLNCGLYFKSWRPASDVLGSYYATLSYQPFNLSIEFPTDAQVRAILRQLPDGSRILDYGCSTGRLIGALDEHFDRCGIEVNQDAANLASTKGIRILAEDAVLSGAHGAFDAIVMTDVFEHLVEPTRLLRALTARLNDGGQLIIVTGLADAIPDRHLMSEHWYFRIYGHLQMLSLRHLEWLSSNLGLDLNRVSRISHYARKHRRFARQRAQLELYRTFRLKPQSQAAMILRRMPLLNRAATWTNMPATDQFADHVVAVLTKDSRAGRAEEISNPNCKRQNAS